MFSPPTPRRARRPGPTRRRCPPPRRRPLLFLLLYVDININQFQIISLKINKNNCLFYYFY